MHLLYSNVFMTQNSYLENAVQINDTQKEGYLIALLERRLIFILFCSPYQTTYL
jgi:hypothetical protein